MTKASRSISQVGGALTAGITLPLAAMGGAAVNTAAKFEQSMANAASVSGATGEEFEKMTELAREMGKTTVFSASEAADAMYYMASAGYKAEQMASSIKPVLDLASATQSELAFTTDTVISTLNQFGMQATEADRVTNVFASAIGNSQATLDKLAYSMRYAGPVAHSLGYSLEETTAALSMLYNAGFKGEQAGTILRGALSRLVKPTKAMTDTLDEMGVSFDQVNPSTNEFADIVAVLEGASITTAQAVSLFGMEAGPGMMALISKGSSALLDMEQKITDTSAASTMAERQLDTFQGSMKIMKSQAEEVAITLGNKLIPIINDLMAKYISPLMEKFNSMTNVSQDMAIKIGLIAAAVGPLVLGLAKFVGILASVAKFAKMALSPMAIKFMAIVAVVTVLVKVFKDLYQNNEEFRASIQGLWEKFQPILELAKSAITKLGEIFAKIFVMVMPLVEQLAEIFLTKLVANIETLMPILQKIFEVFNHLFSGIIKLLNGDFTGAWEDFKNFFTAMWDGILLYLKAVVNSMSGVVNGLLNLVGKGLNHVISGINKISIDIPDWVPIFGGKSWGFNIPEVTMPQIPQLAKGGVIPPNNEFLAILGDQKSGTNIEAPLDTIVSAFKKASSEQLSSMMSMNSRGEIVVRFEGLSDNAFLSALTPKVIGKAKNMGLI